MRNKLEAAFAALLIAFPRIADADIMDPPAIATPDPAYVLPDESFVRAECSVLISQAENYLPSASPRVQTICDDVAKGEITPDEWMIRLDPIAREIDWSIPCPNCLRIFLPERQPVPNGFSTYVLALIPSPELADNNEWVWSFREKFDALGDSIGDEKAAIWLGDRYGLWIDVDRNKYYCDQFDLNYNDGPYILVMNNRPDLITNEDELIYVKMGGIAEDRILRVMNLIEQDLRKGRGIERRTLLFEEVKQRFLSLVERHRDDLRDIVVSRLKK
jgi:hypothetical protein